MNIQTPMRVGHALSFELGQRREQAAATLEKAKKQEAAQLKKKKVYTVRLDARTTVTATAARCVERAEAYYGPSQKGKINRIRKAVNMPAVAETEDEAKEQWAGDGWYSREDVAKAFGLPWPSANHYVRKNGIEEQKRGRLRFFNAAQVDRVAEEYKAKKQRKKKKQ